MFSCFTWSLATLCYCHLQQQLINVRQLYADGGEYSRRSSSTLSAKGCTVPI